jgi:hypothetical protein
LALKEEMLKKRNQPRQSLMNSVQAMAMASASSSMGGTGGGGGGMMSRSMHSQVSSLGPLPPAIGRRGIASQQPQQDVRKKVSMAITVATPTTTTTSTKGHQFFDDLSSTGSPPQSRRSSAGQRAGASSSRIRTGSATDDSEDEGLVLPPIAMSKSQSGPLPLKSNKNSKANAIKAMKNSKSTPVIPMMIEDDASTIPDLGSYHTMESDGLIESTKKKIAKKSGNQATAGGNKAGVKKSNVK